MTFHTKRWGKAGSFVNYGPQWAEAGSAPFSRYKGFMRQGGLVAPFIASGAGVDSVNEIDASYLTVMDLAPTFIEAAGAVYPQFEGIAPMLGTSLVDYLAGRDEIIHQDEDVTVMFHWGSALVRQGDWKLLTPYDHITSWRPFDESEFRLYNVIADPGETQNLREREPEKFAELLGIWRTQRQRLGIILPQDL